MTSILRRLTLILFFAALVAGCSTTSNFKAYYNTFYNARKAYDRGYKTVEKKDTRIDMDVYLPLFVRPSGSTGNRDFESAIVKSADVLRNHGDTKWVDDALLLIGKSYFYQENIVGALEKFREVIDRSSDLENEGRFWLARTFITSRSYPEAQAVLGESINRERVPQKWLAMYALELGELYVRQSLWEEAANSLSTGLKESGDKEISARGYFLLGQVYEQMGRWEDAYSSYSAVQKKNPRYELSFAAKLSAARTDAYNLDFDRGLKALRKLQGDDKNYLYESKIKLQRARALQNGGRGDEAYVIFHDLLYQERDTPLQPSLRGRVHYAVAKYYRDYTSDFVRASAHFDSAATTITGSGASTVGKSARFTQYSTQAISDSRELRDNFGQYAAVYAKAVRLDSLLWLGGLDQAEFDAQIMEYREDLREKMAEQRRRRAQRQLEQQFRQSAETSNLFADRRLPRGKVIANQSTAARERAGFLFHRDPAQVEEGRSNFEVRWGDRPLVSNWRRISAVIVRSAQELVADALLDLAVEGGTEDELPELNTSAVPRDSLSQSVMRAERAIVRYDIGNSLFLAMDMPDSAAVLYRLVIEESLDEPVAQRALYALAEVQRALGDKFSASRLNDEILSSYPDSEFALRIRIQRGLVEPEQEVDLDAVADEEYQAIFQRWQTGSTVNVVDDLLTLVVAYPGMDVRAMALLATGTIHLELAGADSVAILEPVRTSLPDSILGEIWPDKISISTFSEPNDAGAAQTSDSSATGFDALEADADQNDASETLVMTDSLFTPDVSSAADATGSGGDGTGAFEPIFVEDLYKSVVSEYSGSKYARHAKEMLVVITDLRLASEVVRRSARVDTVGVSAATDSLQLFAGADTLFGLDSASVSILTESVDSLISRDSILKEGEIPNPASVEGRIEAPDARRDAPAKDPKNSGVPGAVAVPAARGPGNVSESAKAGESDPIRFPSYDPVEEDLGDEEFLEFDNVKPLMSNGKPDEQASGWTVIIQVVSTMRDAEKIQEEYDAVIGSVGIDVMILVDINRAGGPYRVSWGIFPTKTATDEAIIALNPELPDNYSYMRLFAADR